MAEKRIEFSRGDVVNDKYEVVERLDETPVGTSYRVRHIKSGKHVRLTALDPSFANEQHQNELVAAFKAARALEHPGLLKLGELGDHRGHAYYTYEDIEAQTLHDLLQEIRVEGRLLAVQDSAQILIAVLEALQAVHDAGHLFRALRPEHVLVQAKYVGPRKNLVARVKLLHACFWELVASGALAEEEFTRSDALYLAPELKGIEPVITPRSDVYSAGVLFYEMLTGTQPVGTFQRPTTVRPELPHHVDDIVELALSPAPEDRYQTATDLADDIRRIFQDPDIGPGSERKPLVPPIWWGIGLLAVLAVAILAWQFRPDPAADAAIADAELRSAVSTAYADLDPAEFEAIRAKHPPNMIYVPAGPYLPGRLPAEADAPAYEPLAHVEQVDAFLIDAFEYPNYQGAVPEYGVTWAEADEKCRAAGKRLCTAEEWEKACKGPNSAAYGYGDRFDEAACGNGLEERGYAAGSKEGCKSRWGAFDLSGNFREWTATAPHGKDTRRVVKGGLRHDPRRGSRCAYDVDEPMGLKEASTGFRCCRDADAPPIADGAPAPGDGAPPVPEGPPPVP